MEKSLFIMKYLESSKLKWKIVFIYFLIIFISYWILNSPYLWLVGFKVSADGYMSISSNLNIFIAVWTSYFWIRLIKPFKKCNSKKENIIDWFFIVLVSVALAFYYFSHTGFDILTTPDSSFGFSNLLKDLLGNVFHITGDFFYYFIRFFILSFLTTILLAFLSSLILKNKNE